MTGFIKGRYEDMEKELAKQFASIDNKKIKRVQELSEERKEIVMDEWESIVPHRKFQDFSLDRDVYGVKVSFVPNPSAKTKNSKAGPLKLRIVLDECLLVKMGWPAKSRIMVAANKKEDGLYLLSNSLVEGFRMSKTGQQHTIVVTVESKPKIYKDTHTYWVKFKKVGKSLIVDTREILT